MQISKHVIGSSMNNEILTLKSYFAPTVVQTFKLCVRTYKCNAILNFKEASYFDRINMTKNRLEFRKDAPGVG